MVWLLLSVVGLVGFVHLMKSAQSRGQDVFAAGAVNYVAAAAMAWALLAARAGSAEGLPSPNPGGMLLGAAVGAGYVFTFFILHLGIAGSGAALSGVMTNLAVILSVAAAHFYWRDPASPLQQVGVALTLVALPMIGVRPRENPQALRRPAFWVLAVLFVTSGAWQIAMKVARHLRPEPQALPFIAALFTTAALTMLLALRGRGRRLGRGELLTGLLLGAANLLANLPFIFALQNRSGTLVFATRAGGGVLLNVFLARALWGERLRPLSWIGIVLGAGGLVLVNL